MGNVLLFPTKEISVARLCGRDMQLSSNLQVLYSPQQLNPPYCAGPMAAGV